MTALAFGCGDDGGDDTGAGTTGDPSSSGGPTSASGMSTDPTTGMTSDPMTTGEETGTTTGSTAGESEGSTGNGTSGDTGMTTGSQSACGDTAVVVAISQNHGHALEIPIEDIDAGLEQTYDATGDATHCHAVTLTSEDFATLRAGGVVTKFSCNGGDHEYVISCVRGAPEPGNPADDCVADPEFGSC